MKPLAQSRILGGGLLALLTAIGLLGLRGAGLLSSLELAEYDRARSMALGLRGTVPARALESVVVGYSERDLAGPIGFPLSDEKLARALATILSDEPRAVGVDFFRDRGVPPGGEDLFALLQRERRIVMIHQLSTESDLAVPPPAGASPSQAGLADFVRDPDGHVRRAILYLDDDEFGTALSLPLQMAIRHLQADGLGLSVADSEPPRLRLGQTVLPRFRADDGGYVAADDAGYQILIDYHDPTPRTALDLTDVARGHFEPGFFRDKMVFVGATAHTHTDLHSTPFGDWPGIHLHAQIADQLVRLGHGDSQPIRTLSGGQEIAWVLGWALLGSLIGLRRAPLAATAVSVAAMLFTLAAAVVGAAVAGWWIPGAPAALAALGTSGIVTAYQSRRDYLERSQLMLLFSRHMSKRLADSIWENRDAFLDGGRPRPQRVPATILFLDMKGFTEVAEQLNTLTLMEWLNDFMGAMAHQAEVHGGLVDDYFGDGMKVDFGVPIPSETPEQIAADAASAIRCGLAMGNRLEQLNADWRARGLPETRMRIGIASGDCVAGSFGEKDRLKFTVVGDTVNTAARLESLKAQDVDFGPHVCRLLIADSTHRIAGDHFDTIDRGHFAVKGKQQSVRVHQVVASADANTSANATVTAASASSAPSATASADRPAGDHETSETTR